jgi:hypothetical protein
MGFCLSRCENSEVVHVTFAVELLSVHIRRSEYGATTTTNSGPDDGAIGAGPQTVSSLLDEAPRSKFHRRTVLISGVGFFTDATTCS